MMWALAVYTVFTMVAALAPSYEVFAAARILAGFFSFGYVAAALLGRFVVPSTDTGWRWAQVATAVPIVLLLWWRRSLLESPGTCWRTAAATTPNESWSPSSTGCSGPPGVSFRRSPLKAPMRPSRSEGRVC
jgi:putative MFS transporter